MRFHKILTTVLISFFVFNSLGQNDFRKMNWGDSVQDLLSNYPDVNFEKFEDDLTIYSYDDYIGGINANVAYAFQKNKLVAGIYVFSPDDVLKDVNEHLREYRDVSKRLNDKYIIINTDDWINDSWKDDTESLGHALRMGHVVLGETGLSNNQKTYIDHNLRFEEYSFRHTLIYREKEFNDSNSKKAEDDF